MSRRCPSTNVSISPRIRNAAPIGVSVPHLTATAGDIRRMALTCAFHDRVKIAKPESDSLVHEAATPVDGLDDTS
jgi:hypothetical protein